MLTFSGFSYAQIAAILTFSSQSHFIRVFKRETGFTPRQYRDRFFVSPEEAAAARALIPK